MVERGVASNVAVAAEDRVPDDRLLTDPRVRPQDRLLDDGMLLDMTLPADHTVWTDPCAGLDDDSIVQETRPFDRGAILDAGAGRNPGGRRLGRERLELIASVHHVAMDLLVLFRRADVDPVTAIDVRHERLAPLDERRKEAALDRPRGVLGDAVEGIGLEHVDARVDRVAGDLVRLRLLEEAQDVALRIGLDQPVGAWVLDRREHDGRFRAPFAVQGDHGAQIDLREHVAVQHHHRFVERLAGVAHRSTGPEWRWLDDVADGEPGIAAVAEDFLDPARLVVEAQHDAVNLGHALQQVELIVEKRAVEDRDDRLWRVNRERTQACALAPCEQDGLHAQPPMLSLAESVHEPAELAHGDAHLPRAVARGRAADEVRRPSDSRRADGIRRRRDFRAGFTHRLGRRLPGAPPQADHPVRTVHRSSRRQTADAGGAGVAGADGSRAGVDGGGDSRSRFCGDGAAQPVVRARRRDSGIADRQDQDGRPGRGDPGADPVARAPRVLRDRPGRALGRGARRAGLCRGLLPPLQPLRRPTPHRPADSGPAPRHRS